MDIETDGFDPTVIWCAWVGYKGEYQEFLDAESFNKFIESLPAGTELYAHNGIRFDYPVLTTLWGCDFGHLSLRDSLVLSRLAEPSRLGGHSLRAWGERLGFPKGDWTDWSEYSEGMSQYCLQDVKVNESVLKALEVELQGFSDQSIDLEHATAWIIAEQVSRGWLLQEGAAYDLLATLQERKMDLEDEVRETFRPYPQLVRQITPKVKKDGQISKVGLGAYAEHLEWIGGEFSLVDYPEFNLGSRKQIGEYLIRFGWKPTARTETGQPIVDEGTLNGVDIPEAQLIAEFLMVQKRLAMVQSWIEAVEEDGRVHGDVNPCGANTRRMTHSKPNVAQVPAARSPYGKECRALWIVPEGYKLVGCDAEGLELRCLAHYMNDPEYTDVVVNGRKEDGTDIHTVNMVAAGLSNRDQAKTFIYALLYGAGDVKIGEIVGGGKKEGAELKANFLARTPAMARLRKEVEAASRRGYLRSIDGGRLHIRSQHSALNTLLQGAGAIVMKKAQVICDDYATRNKLDYGFVATVHDEWQAEVLEAHATRFARLSEASITAAGERLGFRCKLAGSADIGVNWYETH